MYLIKITQVGEFKADIIVDDKIIIEIKAVNNLISQHEAQLINYLKATGINVGLLVNFGDKLEFKRRIFQSVAEQNKRAQPQTDTD